MIRNSLPVLAGDEMRGHCHSVKQKQPLSILTIHNIGRGCRTRQEPMFPLSMRENMGYSQNIMKDPAANTELQSCTEKNFAGAAVCAVIPACPAAISCYRFSHAV